MRIVATAALHEGLDCTEIVARIEQHVRAFPLQRGSGGAVDPPDRGAVDRFLDGRTEIRIAKRAGKYTVRVSGSSPIKLEEGLYTTLKTRSKETGEPLADMIQRAVSNGLSDEAWGHH